MNKYILSLFVLFVLCSFSHADPKRPGQHGPNSFSTEGIHNSSNTSAQTSSGQLWISTTSAILHTITKNSNGSSDAKFELFNAQQSTTGVQRIVKVDSTTVNYSGLFDVWCDSGITINNSGATPADITITYFPY